MKKANYYRDCPFPKPGTKKKKKLANGYKNKAERTCAICGRRGAERHELFGGANRQLSIELGLQVDLCQEHHQAIHKRDEEFAKLADLWRAEAQGTQENKWMGSGMTEKEARKTWMALIGKNYRD